MRAAQSAGHRLSLHRDHGDCETRFSLGAKTDETNSRWRSRECGQSTEGLDAGDADCRKASGHSYLRWSGSDQAGALEFARLGLHYPATIYLSIFFFKLWEANHSVADQFYAEALTAYAQTPMDQFLYLSSYPFAANREIGEMSTSSYYQVPLGLVAKSFAGESVCINAADARARIDSEPCCVQTGKRFSDNSQVFMALSRLEPLIANSLPDLAPRVDGGKRKCRFAVDAAGAAANTADTLTDPPKRSFDETIESGDRIADRRAA